MNTKKHRPQDTELNYGLIWLRDRVAANSAFEEIDLTERKHYAVREKNIIKKCITNKTSMQHVSAVEGIMYSNVSR